MGIKKYVSRSDDATFELNLAPMLDIIVAVIPMLLLSVVFVQITMVETPVPQAVQKAMIEQENKNDVAISLHVSKQSGFKLNISDKGQTKDITVGMKGQEFDFDTLHKEVVQVKLAYPNVFRMELNPDEAMELNDIVAVMDKVRARATEDPKIFFKDVDSGQAVETELLFPDVVFGNVAGG